MIIDEIFQTEDFKTLVKEKEKNTFPKALLLISKDNLYLQEFAKAVAMLILDEKVDINGENCKKVLADSHPDVKFYPIKDKLLVSDSQEIVEESFIKPIFANKKVFIIKDISNSMEAAQNKLLKVVEEPSNNVYMILTCTNPDLVLPTIRSRCNKITLAKLSLEQTIKLLPKVENSKLNLVLAVADGQIGKANELARLKNFEVLCDDALSIFTKMKTSKQVLVYSKKLLAYKDNITLILQVLALCVEDLLKIKSGNKDLARLQPFVSELSKVSEEYTVRALCEISALVDKASKEKQYSVNMVLVIENLLLNILEVKYICR